MNFGDCLFLLKSGKKMAREGWNGKNMFVVYQKGYPDGIPCNSNTAKAFGMKEGDLFKCSPYLQLKGVDGVASMWVPSINDTLAEDWYMAEDPMPGYVQRMFIERAMLIEKIKKGSMGLESKLLTERQKEDLRTQLYHMNEYFAILQDRYKKAVGDEWEEI